MGIKNLNKLFRTECCDSIKPISFAELSSKKIAIDISIYMYKYESSEALIENMYIMLELFKQYNITPVFIFDGKPPTEKKELLQKRKQDKKEAEKEYNILKQKLENNDISDNDKKEIITNISLLKKQFVYISREKINIIKSLIRSYGVTYYDAPREADELCALLVLKNKVWACISEDMDMFVYGCPRVIRYFSLFSCSALLYDTKKILNKLNITQYEFKQICVLSGTDYNIQTKNNPNLHETINLFNKYKNNNNNNNNNESLDFYNWLKINSEYIIDNEYLKNIINIFDLNNIDLLIFEKIKIVNSSINIENIKNILKTDNFIFPP